MSYDKTYSRYENVFGENPEQTLIDFYKQINISNPVLDIGSGQGRNSIFLAENNFRVDAIDTSLVAVESLSEISRRRNLPINCFYSSYNEFKPIHSCYGAVLVFGLIQILSGEQIYELIEIIRRIICPEGLIFVTAFGVEDTGYKKCAGSWKKAGRNTFSDEQNNYRTYLANNEILELFEGFESLYHKENWGKEHHHGDGVLEKHFMVEAVFKNSGGS